MSTTNLRNAAVRRSNLRDYVRYIFSNTHNLDASCYDVEGLVADLDDMDADTGLITTSDFWQFAARHEFDGNHMTIALWAKALKNSQTGWVAAIRHQDGNTQMMNLNIEVEDETAEIVEARLRKFVNFPEGTSILILPVVE